jgi:3-phenylpropionate/trans-cinnamate dioxygenase ferredoxin reductase subunit
MRDPVVIVGTGQAAAKAAETLRSSGYDGALVLVGDEAHPPYQRPPLSKQYLSGDSAIDDLLLWPQKFCQDNSIDLRMNTRIVAIDAAARRVDFLKGGGLTYAKLLLTTGARARYLPIEGNDLDGVVTLRHIVDADEISTRLKNVERAAVIGGGYIGLEAAAFLSDRGVRVTVVEGRERLMTRVVSEPVSRFFEVLHRERGVAFRMGATVERIVGRDRVEGVQLGDGNIVPADIVLVAIGSKPNDELAAAAGLIARDGILVDTRCRTAAPDVLAAGDCTRFWSGRYRREVRLESVQNAVDQGRAAGLTILGEDHEYDPLPWFWSDQYGTKLQIIGLSEGYDRISVANEGGNDSLSVRYYLGERLIAVDAINAPRSYLRAKRALTEGIDLQDQLNPPAGAKDSLRRQPLEH